MIVILNQHKGTLIELLKCLKNDMELRLATDKFRMILVVDQLTDTELTDEIRDSLVSEFPSVKFLFNETCMGLSRCRKIAIKWVLEHWPEVDYFFTGCTNSRWIMQLDDTLHDRLMEHYRKGKQVILHTCVYPEGQPEIFYAVNGYVNIDTWINDVNRPECTIVMSKVFVEKALEDAGVISFGIEKYCPEDLIWYYGAHHGQLLVLDPIQSAYFNPNGMTKTFSRKTVLENKGGFYHRAETLLSEWSMDNITLSSTRLKELAYDYVTLGETVKVKTFKNTVLEPIIDWALLKWTKDNNYFHEIKFIE